MIAPERNASGSGVLWSLARVVSGPRSWVVLLLGLAVAAGIMAGGAGSSNAGPDNLPADSEAAQAAEVLRDFPGGDSSPAILVYSRSDGTALTPADLAAAAQATARVATADRGVASAPAGPPVLPAQDGQAALGVVPVSADLSGLDLTDTVQEMRDRAADGLPAGLTVQLTGGPGFGADIADAFTGADVTLLLSTAAVVAVLLLITYRSPILWLVPLFVVALADRCATIVAGLAAQALGWELDGSTSGITSVLVFGAGTNYALLIVSRYREELRRDADHRAALTRAVRYAAPAVLASNLTVVLALCTLLLAALPNTTRLGFSAAIGLLVALVFSLALLPPALALCGRGLFWPFVPRPTDPDRSTRGGWYVVASFVARRPVTVLAATIPLLALLCAGLVGMSVGLKQTDQFRVSAESVDGFAVLEEHFPQGLSNPTTLIARTGTTGPVQEAAQGTPGVVEVSPNGRSDGGWSRWQVVLDAEPASPEAFAAIEALRDRTQAVPGSQAMVGGTDAQQFDSRAAAERDQRLLIPLILLVVLSVLFVLLKSVIAPLVLIVATTVSAFAALGAGTWISLTVLGFPALDTSVLLFAFLFLVALGVDYTIFLVVRAREETPEHGTRAGIVRAVALTGGVITSAGIVLAAVFAVLGVLPLITLTQLGIIVGIGILLDTFVVRTVVIPALFSVVGPAVWWPSALSRAGEGDHRDAAGTGRSATGDRPPVRSA